MAALADYGITVTIYDPWANSADELNEYRLTITNSHPELVEGQPTKYDAIVLGLSHKEFSALNLGAFQKENNGLYDVKGVLEGNVDGKL